MQWILLAVAGALEVLWACAMKFSDGFTKIIPSAITFTGYIASAVFLSLALKKLPLGIAYALWTGLSIIGTSIVGIFLFRERLSLVQCACIALIVIGIAGLKLLSLK